MGKHAVSKLFKERPLESAGSELRLVGIDDPHLDSSLGLSDPDGFDEIRVVADDHCGIATVLKSV
ncbi:MAG: hypothetical protein OXF00_04470 [bacterium]|nr:hypothetical protein [bacterium]